MAPPSPFALPPAISTSRKVSVPALRIPAPSPSTSPARIVSPSSSNTAPSQTSKARSAKPVASITVCPRPAPTILTANPLALMSRSPSAARSRRYTPDPKRISSAWPLAAAIAIASRRLPVEPSSTTLGEKLASSRRSSKTSKAVLRRVLCIFLLIIAAPLTSAIVPQQSVRILDWAACREEPPRTRSSLVLQV